VAIRGHLSGIRKNVPFNLAFVHGIVSEGITPSRPLSLLRAKFVPLVLTSFACCNMQQHLGILMETHNNLVIYSLGSVTLALISAMV